MMKLIPGDEKEEGREGGEIRGISVQSKYEYENLGKCEKEH